MERGYSKNKNQFDINTYIFLQYKSFPFNMKNTKLEFLVLVLWENDFGNMFNLCVTVTVTEPSMNRNICCVWCTVAALHYRESRYKLDPNQ